MKNLFLLFVAILLLLILKEAKTEEQLQVLDISKKGTINFNGKLFLPRTLPRDTQPVNRERFNISLSGKNYHYIKEYGRFTLEQVSQAEEVPVKMGDKVRVSGKTKLFFAREIL